MSKIAWIGLGVMGYPMAGHLKMRGHHDVVVFNRTRKRADAWVADLRRHRGTDTCRRGTRCGLRLHLCRQ